ncbi:MAG: GNAT family N-acetyltransferase [Clostridia bacterium]
MLHTDEGQPVGFAYGYRSIPGQFYRSLLEEHLSGADRAAWLDECFEFVALGVIPEHRRRGYGRLLHDAVLQRAAERIAILTTEASNSASRALYTGLGWQLLSPGFRPPGAAEPFVIMVKTLKTESVG